MIFVYYFFAAVVAFLGWKSLRGGIDYLNFFKSELARPPTDFAPFVSIIAPCRGLENGLAENLSALFRQKFPRYEILFVVDDERDEAVPVIKNFAPEKLIIAGKADGESQKVHNLRQAVPEISDESEVLVIVDSDARPDENWLANLIAPLQDETVGASTGYRWFVQKNGGFATHLRSVWNASIASALGANERKNFCWGGSTALRRDVFENLNIREKWRGTLSDDFVVTRAVSQAGLKIRFVPQCLTASVEDCGFGELLEFTTRQMKITRVYAPHLWKAASLGAALFSAVFFTGILLLFFLSGWHFAATLAFTVVIFLLGAGKAHLRLKAAKLVLHEYEKELNRQTFFHLSLWTITPVLFFYNSLLALFSRKIVWRGIEYELKSPNKTIVNLKK